MPTGDIDTEKTNVIPRPAVERVPIRYQTTKAERKAGMGDYKEDKEYEVVITERMGTRYASLKKKKGIITTDKVVQTPEKDVKK